MTDFMKECDSDLLSHRTVPANSLSIIDFRHRPPAGMLHDPVAEQMDRLGQLASLLDGALRKRRAGVETAQQILVRMDA